MTESGSLPVAARFAIGRDRFNSRLAEIKSLSILDMASASSDYLASLRSLKNDSSLDKASVEAVEKEIARFMSERDVADFNLSATSDRLSALQVGYIEKNKSLRAAHTSALEDAFRQYASFLETLVESADDNVADSVVEDINQELLRVQGQLSADAAPAPRRSDAGAVLRTPAAPVDVLGDDAGVIAEIFKGRVLKFNPTTYEVSIVYDFSDPAQKEDWDLAGWIRDAGRGEWDIINGAVQVNRLPGPLLNKAVFRDVSIVGDFHVAGSEASVGVVAGAAGNGDFYCMMGLERGQHSVLRRYEKGARAGVLSKAYDSPFRVYGKGRVGVAISGKSVHGEVGLGRFRGDASTYRRGQVGLFAPGSHVRFESVRISGVLDERWYKTEKRRAERVR